MSTTRRRRPALIALVAVSVITFLGLAWWQWQRFESVTGDGQNLGYAMQWPLFAGFMIYAYRRFVVYEDEGPPPRVDRVTEIPEGLLPARPASATAEASADTNLTQYNAYLAALAEEDRKLTP